jgi:hypothetical protein
MIQPLREFDPDTVSLMGRTCDEAWEQLRSTTYIPLPEERDVRNGMARRVMEAVAAGERDPLHLITIALDSVDAVDA